MATATSSTRSWGLALSIALFSLVAILLLASSSHRWQPEKVTVAPYGNDFLQEWIGGKIIMAGHAARLYDIPIFQAYQHDARVTGFEWSRATYFPPVYPPPHYLIATCLAWIPYRFAAIAWLFLLAIAMALGSWITAKYVVRFKEFDSNPAAKNFLERWTWIAIALFPATIYCFVVGQKGPFWLLIFAATWALLRRRLDGWAGIVFGLLSIKPTLFFLLPLVMLRYRRWRFVAGASLSVIVLWVGAFVVLPIEVWSGFADKLGMTSSYAGIQGYHLDWSCNLMSLSYIAQDAFMHGLLKWFFVLPLCIYGLYLVIAPRSLQIDHPRTLWNVLIVTYLLSPHAYYYDLVILLIPILWYAAIESRRCVIYYSLLVAAIVLAPVALESMGIPLIPIVLAATILEQRLKGLGQAAFESIGSSQQTAGQIATKSRIGV